MTMMNKCINHGLQAVYTKLVTGNLSANSHAFTPIKTHLCFFHKDPSTANIPFPNRGSIMSWNLSPWKHYTTGNSRKFTFHIIIEIGFEDVFNATWFHYENCYCGTSDEPKFYGSSILGKTLVVQSTSNSQFCTYQKSILAVGSNLSSTW